MYCGSNIRYIVILVVSTFCESVLYITQDVSFVAVQGSATVKGHTIRCRLFCAIKVLQDLMESCNLVLIESDSFCFSSFFILLSVICVALNPEHWSLCVLDGGWTLLAGATEFFLAQCGHLKFNFRGSSFS